MLLTAELLLHYQRCNRRAFLDVYGDLTQMVPLSDFQVKLQQDRVAHERTVLAGSIYQQPYYPRRDWQAGAEATLALMQQGVERIHKGVLLGTSEGVGQEMDRLSPLPVRLLSCPDLLVKQPGESQLGDWIYVPADIQLGKRPKLEYQIVAAFHAQILASMQGVIPETAWLILRERGLYRVNLGRVLPQMQSILAECIQMLLLEQEPEVFISRQRCNLCRWYDSCYAIAQSQKHLSLLPGVTPTRYSHLQALNLTTVESLADTTPEHLEPVLERDVAQKLVLQAQSVCQNQPILTSTSVLSADSLPTAPIELYFDIEAEPELGTDFMLGVLVVDRQAKTEAFYPYLAEHPADEGFIWQQFLELVWAYSDAPIFHFCDYEVETVKRLAKCYSTPSEKVRPLLKRFVDIHARVTESVTLPIESYALKPIARWLNFEWRDPKANGQMCIYWYDQWLKTSDRAFLDMIVRYNEDDCRATHHVKNWLVTQLYCNAS